MSKGKDLQALFLTSLCKNKIPVAIYLVSGIKLQGKIESFDAFILLLANGATLQMVYKHTISTIVPTEKISLEYKIIETENDKN